MCPAISMNLVGSDLWNASVHSALSVAFRITAAVQKNATVSNLAGKIWRLDRKLAGMLDTVYASAKNPPPNLEPVTPECLIDAIATIRYLKYLNYAIERIHISLNKSGMSNYSLIGAPASSLRAHADDLLDLAESLDVAMNPDIDSIFNRSIEEYHRGETIELQDIL
jgi:hypothetical protein